MKVIVSGRMEELLDRLVEGVRDHPASASAALDGEVVLVQSQGMAHWLRLQLASRLGVCMQVSFPFPRKYLLETLASNATADVRRDQFKPEVMGWRILGLLPQLAGESGFEEVRSYLGSPVDALKASQLSRTLANLLDQYTTYRPTWIRDWQQGRSLPSEHGWQARVWQRLCAGSDGTHPVLRLKDGPAVGPPPAVSSALARGPERLAAEISMASPMGTGRVFAVITTTPPPVYLAALEAAARSRPVTLLVLGGCRRWWVDVHSGEDRAGLLDACGRQGRELARLVKATGRPTSGEVQIGHGWAPEGRSMLQQLQAELALDPGTGAKADPREGENADGGGATEGAVSGPEESSDPGLDSLQVHACHSPLREVEVLHDHLRLWLEKDAELNPRDILVVTPDLETYAPHIRSVFAPEVRHGESETAGQVGAADPIPYGIADRVVRRGCVAADVFLRILDLAGSRLGADQVLDLLEAAPVRSRFGIEETDLATIAGWVEATGIRWGRDAEQRMGLGLPGIAETTWRHGLDQMLLGQAMPGLPADGPATGGLGTGTDAVHIAGEGAACFTQIEGQGVELMGRFVDFAETLFSKLESIGVDRTLGEWSKDLLETFDALVDGEEDPASATPVRDALEALERQATAGGLSEAKFPFVAVRESLRGTLETTGEMGDVVPDGVTVCGMRWMRGVPFRVVCVLGLADGRFPRRDPRIGFDLLRKERRDGDPSPRHDDRQLFLQLLQSARDRFYLSHVGRSDRDNSEVPPSVLVTELLDHVRRRFPAEAARVRREHPLHAHDRVYFEQPDKSAGNGSPAVGSRRWFSYSRSACAASRILARAGTTTPAWRFFEGKPLPEAPDDAREIRVEDLITFIQNPSRHFLERRLQVWLPDAVEDAMGDAEPFDLDPLQRYNLEAESSSSDVAGEGEAQRRLRRWQTEGRLPLGQPGRLEHAEIESYARWIREKAAEVVGPGRRQATPFDLRLGAFRLTGTVELTPSGGVAIARAGKLRAKYRLRAWVLHLIAQTAGHAGEGLLMGEDADRDKATKAPLFRCLRYRSLGTGNGATPGAKQLLLPLLEAYWEGLRRPLPFFPESSMDLTERLIKDVDEAKALGAAERKWAGNDHSPGECEDRHIAYCFRGQDDPLDADFVAWSMKLAQPLLGHENEP